ncbi:MAG: deoxyribodipyrimidine photo-lyase [Chlamydiia bacterium]|nr:deoxyribodipyrimidine photo-lyase [Chlamydiia bacterium]
MTQSIFWFRQDLRLRDNPGLIEAAKQGSVLPIYILDDKHQMGEASRWWLHHSLQELSKSLNEKLVLFKGDPLTILRKLIASEGIGAVYWNRCYEPWKIKRDQKIKEALKKEGIEVQSFKASLLWEPWEIHKSYKVFTPFYQKGCLALPPPRDPLLKPSQIALLQTTQGETLELLPKKNWGDKLKNEWKIGEEAAHHRLATFLQEGLPYYKGGRDFPACPYVSRLSPHLHFGEISPYTLWDALKKERDEENVSHFQKELGWREFSYSLLYTFPDLPNKNFQAKFDRFPWKKDPQKLKKWQKGQTGIPFVDAAMRELWQTGYMHNRARMVVASFLVKNLLIHWHEGAAWFWDCLVDADLANNSASWQWVAGCGADAAPYFRIFNPVTQGEKFDPDGAYIHQYVPELKHLHPPHLFSPWTASKQVLEKAGVELGKNYPYPIVDLKESRKEALKAFKSQSGL